MQHYQGKKPQITHHLPARPWQPRNQLERHLEGRRCQRRAQRRHQHPHQLNTHRVRCRARDDSPGHHTGHSDITPQIGLNQRISALPVLRTSQRLVLTGSSSRYGLVRTVNRHLALTLLGGWVYFLPAQCDPWGVGGWGCHLDHITFQYTAR